MNFPRAEPHLKNKVQKFCENRDENPPKLKIFRQRLFQYDLK